MKLVTGDSPAGRVIRAYSPLWVFGLFLLFIALFVPTADREVRTVPLDAGGGLGNLGRVGGEPGAALGGGTSANGLGDSVGDSTGPAAGRAGTGATGGREATAEERIAGGALGGAQRCADRELQVPGDPYSPICIAFSGDNLGDTTRGVTTDSIVVSRRDVGGVALDQAVGVVDSSQIDDAPEAIARTYGAVIDYVNKNFQFYGRKLQMQSFKGSGDWSEELLFQRGPEKAEADAVVAAEDIGAFADITGTTAPYADALARRKVVAFGTPYLSRDWHASRSPYTWSIYTDCSVIAESVSAVYNRLLADDTVSFAGPAFTGRSRRLGVIVPENPAYQECVSAGRRIVEDAGNSIDVLVTYKLDPDALRTTAASVIAKLKAEKVTTVFCACDPIAPIFFTSKATEQNYEPEWLHGGTTFMDVDALAQQYDQDQWARAAGISYLGSETPRRAGLGYRAYKTVRPDSEPSSSVELIYSQVYMLALGVHLAGPNLTPDTFEDGLRSYRGSGGQFGTWAFPAPNHTPTTDFRFIWWDPKAQSAANGKNGSYIESYDGKRFAPDRIPSEPDFFRR